MSEQAAAAPAAHSPRMFQLDAFRGIAAFMIVFYHLTIVYRLGGPPDYLRERGHPRLRMRHAPFPIDRAARDRWMELMCAAMEEAGLPADIRAYLDGFLGDIATFLQNRPS